MAYCYMIDIKCPMQAEARVKELMGMSIGVKIVTIGKKAAVYFKCVSWRRKTIPQWRSMNAAFAAHTVMNQQFQTPPDANPRPVMVSVAPETVCVGGQVYVLAPAPGMIATFPHQCLGNDLQAAVARVWFALLSSVLC